MLRSWKEAHLKKKYFYKLFKLCFTDVLDFPFDFIILEGFYCINILQFSLSVSSSVL